MGVGGQFVSESGFLREFISAASVLQWAFLPYLSTFQVLLPLLSDGISALMSQVEMGRPGTVMAVWFVHEICCCCESQLTHAGK